MVWTKSLLSSSFLLGGGGPSKVMPKGLGFRDGRLATQASNAVFQGVRRPTEFTYICRKEPNVV